jgi:hypothetical protein
VASENETLRWPTNLDRAGIEKRLVQVREAAQAAGLAELAAKFADVQKMSGAQIGAAVVAALTAVQEKPDLRAIATQLEMVAMNLKNLKNLKG